MSDTTLSTPKVDLLTRILEVDLSISRPDFKLDPMPEGHVALGTLSPNAQKVFWLWFNLGKEISVIQSAITDAVKAHGALHMSGEITDSCKEHCERIGNLEQKLENLTWIEYGLSNLLTAMIKDEFPEITVDIVDSFTINKGFIISKNPAPQEKRECETIVLEVKISKSKHPEQKGDAHQEPSETATNQPTMSEK